METENATCTYVWPLTQDVTGPVAVKSNLVKLKTGVKSFKRKPGKKLCFVKFVLVVLAKMFWCSKNVTLAGKHIQTTICPW